MSEADKTPEEIEPEDAADKTSELKDSVRSANDPYGGSGGDIGSGPTGDVRNSPEIVADGPDTKALIAAAGAFAVGLALGWAIWR